MKKTHKRILIGVISFLVIGCVMTVGVTGYITYSNITRLSNNEDTGAEKSIAFFNEISFNYEEFKQENQIDKIKIPSSFDEHIIPADLIYSNEKNADTIVMVHGLGGNRQSVFPTAKMFLDKGYNVLAYDQRSAGENTAKYTTFGYLESYDTADCVAYLDEMLNPDQEIYLWGISNGAATSGLSVRHEIVEARVVAIILDCPFSGTDEIMRQEIAHMNMALPTDFVMFCGSIFNSIALGYTYEQASVANNLADSKIPLLILASKADELTPYWMAEQLHKASPNSKLITIEDSEHANIFYDYPEKYESEVFKFIEKKLIDKAN